MRFTKHLRIFWIIFSTRVGKQISLPVDSLMRSAGTLCFVVFYVVLTKFLLNNYNFPGWTPREFWIFLFCFQFLYYGAFVFLWEGLKGTANEINRGAFDFILIKPVNSRFLTFFRPGQINNLLAFITGMVALLVLLVKFGYGINPLTIFTFLLFTGVSLWTLHCISMTILCLNFRYPGVEHLRATIFSVYESYKYPTSVYDHSPFLVKIFIVPFSLMTTIPATMLLTKQANSIHLLLYGLLAFGATITSVIAWRWGLKNYTSAS